MVCSYNAKFQILEGGLIFEIRCTALAKSQISFVHLKTLVCLVIHALWFRKNKCGRKAEQNLWPCSAKHSCRHSEGLRCTAPIYVFLVNLVLPVSTINRFLQKVFLLFLKKCLCQGTFLSTTNEPAKLLPGFSPVCPWSCSFSLVLLLCFKNQENDI